MKNVLRHLRSFIAPVVVSFVLPCFIVSYEHSQAVRPLFTNSKTLLILGAVVSITGLILTISTIRMFILIGKGTIMPWDPSRKLIVSGLYAHVRNPMILSINLLLIGQAMLFSSVGIAVLVIFSFIFNTIYFILFEEPGLEKRFGREYLEYKKNVPRWFPRLKPWKPAGTKNN